VLVHCTTSCLLWARSTRPIADHGARQQHRAGQRCYEAPPACGLMSSEFILLPSVRQGGCSACLICGVTLRPCTRLKMAAPKPRGQVAKISPPITARPNGWFCPGSIAIGSMPMTIASAVTAPGETARDPPRNAALVAQAGSICFGQS